MTGVRLIVAVLVGLLVAVVGKFLYSQQVRFRTQELALEHLRGELSEEIKWGANRQKSKESAERERHQLEEELARDRRTIHDELQKEELRSAELISKIEAEKSAAESERRKASEAEKRLESLRES